MKIALVNPPQVFSRWQIAAGVIPPLSVLYLAAYCRQHGHDVKIVEALVEAPDQINTMEDVLNYRGLDFDQIAQRIDKDTDVIGISNLFSFAFPVILKMAKDLKKRRPKAKIVLGGAHPSATMFQTAKFKCFDYIVNGEGEDTFLKLLDVIAGKKKIEELDGIGYHKGNQIIVVPKKDYIEDLDSLPFPARDMIPLENYFRVREAHGPSQERWTPILATRGCPFICTFCTSRIWNRKWRARSAKNIVDEIEHCMKKYDITEFHFEDENLTLNKPLTLDMCKEIIKRGLKIKWQTPNGIRASATDEEMLDAMKAAGCYHITVAPESGSQRVLNDIIKKGQNFPHVERVVQYAAKIGIKVAAYFILGLPGEKVEDMEMTIKYAQRLAKVGLDEVAFSLFIPLPGSDLFTLVQQQGKAPKDWSYGGSIQTLSVAKSWSDHITDEQLFKYRKRAYLKFHATKFFYHPQKVLWSIMNILRDRQETKTERAVSTLLKRFIGVKSSNSIKVRPAES